MDLWKSFCATGSVADYLKYKENEKINGVVQSNANENKGISNQRTDGWGK